MNAAKINVITVESDCPTCHRPIVTELTQGDRQEIVCEHGHRFQVLEIGDRTPRGTEFLVEKT